jgi:hypothetical protein
MKDLSWYTGGKKRKGKKGKLQGEKRLSSQIKDDSDGDADYVYAPVAEYTF